MATNNSNQPIQVVSVDDVNKRFDRIEQKIDKLSDAMISLARTEEKIMAMENERANITERLNRHSEKIDELGEKVSENSRTTANINKFIWGIILAVITVGVQAFFK